MDVDLIMIVLPVKSAMPTLDPVMIPAQQKTLPCNVNVEPMQSVRLKTMKEFVIVLLDMKDSLIKFVFQ